MDLSFHMFIYPCYTLGMGKEFDPRSIPLLSEKICRGKPQLIIYDNSPQFKVVKTAVGRQWKQLMLDGEVRHYITEGGIKWQFTTALAPWQGGFYERLVALVKRSL